MKKSIKELFEEYKKSPRQDWINDYKDRCAEVQKYKAKEASDYDTSFLEGVWKIPANGIANASPGIMSNEEFGNLQNELPLITSKILSNPTPDTLDKTISWAKDAKNSGKFKSVKWGVIHRVFAAASPETYSTLLNIDHIEKLIGKLNSLYGLGIVTAGNWAELNISLMSAMRSQGLQDEDVYLVNTFTWELYVSLVQNEASAPAKISGNPGSAQSEESPCSNVIYYGPPGTGKTFKLQELLKDKYTDNTAMLDSGLWLNDNLEGLSWFEIVILVLLDFGKPISVSDIIAHDYFQSKAYMNERTANIRQTAWAVLQTHTVQGSVTVKHSQRLEPAVFDKNEDSSWYIVDDQKEQLEEYQELLEVLKSGPKQTDIIKRYEFVTFHQSYGYEEFIEGLRPVTNSEGDISYEVKPGVFKRICKRAEADPDNQYVIVIDEINRGNISKIFGELITLVETDKRSGSDNALTVTLPYSGMPFSVPSNIDIIGTMNTADRSLTHIDVALRRRFDFKELRTDYSLVSSNVDGINIQWLLYAINQRIELLLDREHILGHALVMNVKSVDDLEHVFKTNIMPLLEEYFFENWDKIKQVLNNNGFIEEQKDAHNTWLGGIDEYAAMTYRIDLNALKDIGAYIAIYSDIDSSAFSECEAAAAEM